MIFQIFMHLNVFFYLYGNSNNVFTLRSLLSGLKRALNQAKRIIFTVKMMSLSQTAKLKANECKV